MSYTYRAYYSNGRVIQFWSMDDKSAYNIANADSGLTWIHKIKE